MPIRSAKIPTNSTVIVACVFLEPSSIVGGFAALQGKRCAGKAASRSIQNQIVGRVGSVGTLRAPIVRTSLGRTTPQKANRGYFTVFFSVQVS
jgi:hypothetical protein